MTDWNSPLTLERNGESWMMLVHALLGIGIWDWITTLDFDISIFLGRRQFRWPMINYLCGRYSLLGCGIVACILLDSPQELNCEIGYRVLTALGSTSVGCASLNLCIRTLAVWNHDRRVVIPLALMSLGHFGILFSVVTTAHAAWQPGFGCVTVSVNARGWVISLVYTVAFDLVILVLTAYKLRGLKIRKGGPPQHTNGLARLLFQDGLGYFLLAFIVNIVAMVFSILYLNPITVLIADGPAISLSTILSGRVVRRLMAYNDKEMSLTAVLPHLSNATCRTSRSQASGPFANVLRSNAAPVELTTLSNKTDPGLVANAATPSMYVTSSEWHGSRPAES